MTMVNPEDMARDTIDNLLNAIVYVGEINGKNLYLGWTTGEKEYLRM